jgi:hypothetical protein
MNKCNESVTPAQGAAPTYSWKQIYGMGDGVFHWALCDNESERDGKVSCAYMVLLADYPTGMDGKPVGEQFMPKKITEALNSRDGLMAALERIAGQSDHVADSQHFSDPASLRLELRALASQARAELAKAKGVAE